MESVLRFIMKFLHRLYREKGFKFVDSDVQPIYGESAYVKLSDGCIDIVVSKSRDGIEIEVGRNKKAYFPIWLIMKYMNEETKPASGNYDELYGQYLSNKIDTIRDLLTKESYSRLSSELQKIAEQRSM